jgi:hypothetical protein
MCFGNKKPSLLSTVRALNSTREALLSHGKHVLGLLKEAGVAYLCAIRHGEEGLAAHIDTHDFTSWKKHFIRHIITREDHKPLIGRASADNDRLDSTLNRTREPDLKSAYVADGEIFAIELPATLLEGEGVVSLLALESGKSSLAVSVLHPAKERLVGLIQAFNHILEALRAYNLIFWESLFKARKFLILVVPGDRLMVVPVGSDALFKGCVVEIATEVKPSDSVLDSLRVRLNAIFEGLFHCPVPSFSIAQSREVGKPYQASPSIFLALKGRSLDGVIY